MEAYSSVGNTTPWEVGLKLPNKIDEIQQVGIEGFHISQCFHLMAFCKSIFQHLLVASHQTYRTFLSTICLKFQAKYMSPESGRFWQNSIYVTMVRVNSFFHNCSTMETVKGANNKVIVLSFW